MFQGEASHAEATVASAWDALVRAQALTLPMVNLALRRRHQLSLSEFIVLREVAAGEPISMTELQERAFLSGPGITRVVGSLVAAGWLSRTRQGADRRLLYARTTPDGLALLRKAELTLTEELQRLFRTVDDTDDLLSAIKVLKQLGDSAITIPTAR